MSESLPTTPEPAADGEYMVIARRYRPQAFEELVGQEHVARALQQAITSDRVGHAYLFTGARGVGKTSAARILAKALNCVKGPTPTPCNECDVCLRVTTGDDMDILEIDGASNNGVDEIRQLRQNVAVRPSRVRFKVYIIDEVHMLSKSAFNALLKTLEEPPEHVKFIFATTEPHKIPITILSRCQRFDFAGISAGAIQGRLQQIAAAEGVELEHDAVQILASRAAGSMRDSQSLLEQLLSVAEGRITADDVNRLIGIAPAERLSELVRHLVAGDAAGALGEVDAALAGGVEIGLLLDQLVGYFRDVMTAAVGCSAERLLYALPSQAEEVAQIGRQLGLQTILAIVQILDQTSARMRVSIHARTLVEMAVVRVCHVGDLDDLASLVAELRGERGEQPVSASARPVEAAKKNIEPPVTLAASLERQLTEGGASLGKIPPLAAATKPPAEIVLPPRASVVEANPVVPVAAPAPTVAMAKPEEEAVAVATNGEAAPAAEASVLKQFQQAMANPQNGAETPARPARPSRRQQLAEIAEQPFVKRAMELFDVAPGQFRYTPPEGDAN